MCYFIAIVAFSEAGAQDAETMLGRMGRKIWQDGPTGKLAGLPAGAKPIYSMSGLGCDCESEVGSLGDMPKNRYLLTEKERKRYQKMGWSDKKIERLEAEKKKKADRDKREFERLQNVVSNSAESEWAVNIRSYLQNASHGRIGIIKHWFSTKVDCSAAHTIDAPVNLNELIHKLEQDKLYIFTKHAAQRAGTVEAAS